MVRLLAPERPDSDLAQKDNPRSDEERRSSFPWFDLGLPSRIGPRGGPMRAHSSPGGAELEQEGRGGREAGKPAPSKTSRPSCSNHLNFKSLKLGNQESAPAQIRGFRASGSNPARSGSRSKPETSSSLRSVKSRRSRGGPQSSPLRNFLLHGSGSE